MSRPDIHNQSALQHNDVRRLPDVMNIIMSVGSPIFSGWGERIEKLLYAKRTRD